MKEYKTFKVGNEVLIDATEEQNAELYVNEAELELARRLQTERLDSKNAQ